MTDGVAGSNDHVPLPDNRMPQLPPLPQPVPNPEFGRAAAATVPNPAYGRPAAATTSNQGTGAPSQGPTVPPRKKRKKSSRKARTRVVIGALVVVLAAALIVPPLVNEPNLADYREQVSKLDGVISDSESLLSEVPDGYEASLVADIESDVEAAGALLDADEPHAYSFTIRAQADEIYESRQGILALTDELDSALQTKADYDDYVSHANDVMADAQSLLETTSGQVDNDATRTELADAINSLEWELGLDADHAEADGYSEALTNLEGAVGDVENASDNVESSNEAWITAEEEQALTDPANYGTISDRDWQLLERTADSHTGEKYVLYGYVTQADSAMGSYGIRVNTSGEQLGSWYDYEINTIVLAASDDLLSTVITGDTVKLLVEVQGSTSYDTAIGGTATAITVLAYSVEIIG